MGSRRQPPYRFGKRSMEQIQTVVPELRGVLLDAICVVNFTVLTGRRSRADQDRAFDEGKSRVRWPDSKHNTRDPNGLVQAVDVAPWPIDWEDRERFAHLAGVLQACAVRRNLALRWGGDWNRDGIPNRKEPNASRLLDDLVHFELDSA